MSYFLNLLSLNFFFSLFFAFVNFRSGKTLIYYLNFRSAVAQFCELHLHIYE